MMIEYRSRCDDDMCCEQWFIAATSVDVYRDYELFGYLAGVTGLVSKPLVSPRGFPENMWYSESDLRRMDWWGDHTPSWLTAKELKKLKPKFKKEPWYKCVRAYADNHGDDNVRIVFSFSN